MLAAVADLLACPVCGAGLTSAEAGLACPAGHRFDLARQGYLNLARQAPPRNADTAAMVAARERFLGGGHYAPLAEALVATVTRHAPGADAVLDAGAGPGWYVANLLQAGAADRGLAVDVSPAAARRAARAHPRIGSVVADVWAGLPVRAGVVDVLLDVFAPRAPEEFGRVLRAGGLLVVATPLPGHLEPLRTARGLLGVEPGKQDRLRRAVEPWFVQAGSRTVRHPLELSPDAVADLIGMGPNAFHARDAAPPGPARVEVAVEVSAWLRRPTSRPPG